MIICSFEMFKHRSVFFKDFGSVLISWLQKMHVTSMYTYTHTNAHMHTHMPHPCIHVHTETHTCTHKCMWVCMHMCVHTHTPLLALTLSPCFDYIPINSQNNFFTNCVLSILCCLWLPVLIKIKNKPCLQLSRSHMIWLLTLQLLLFYPTLCSWSPTTGVLLFFPQAKLISTPELFFKPEMFSSCG